MENFEQRIAQEISVKHGYDSNKTFENKQGFQVTWFNSDYRNKKRNPGIYIRLFKPNGGMKEEKYFEFGQEDDAQKQLDDYINTLKAWESVG